MMGEKNKQKTTNQKNKPKKTNQKKSKPKTINSARFETQRDFVPLPNRRSLLIPLALQKNNKQKTQREQTVESKTVDVESKWYQQAAAIGEKHKVSLSFKPCAVYCCWFVFCFVYCV